MKDLMYALGVALVVGSALCIMFGIGYYVGSMS